MRIRRRKRWKGLDIAPAAAAAAAAGSTAAVEGGGGGDSSDNGGGGGWCWRILLYLDDTTLLRLSILFQHIDNSPTFQLCLEFVRQNQQRSVKRYTAEKCFRMSNDAV